MARSKRTEVKIAWDKEEAGGGRFRFKEADYHVRIAKAEYGRSKERDTPYIEFTFKFKDGRYKGEKITESLYLTAKSLRRLRTLCEVVGIKVPKKAARLDLTKFRGKELGITLEDDEYKNNKGKKVKRSRVAFDGFMTVEDLESGGVSDDSDDSDSDSDVSEDSDSSADSTDDSDDTEDSDSDVSVDSDSI
jgi:hypothetical protein